MYVSSYSSHTVVNVYRVSKYVKGGLPHFSPWTAGMCSVQLEDM